MRIPLLLLLAIIGTSRLRAQELVMNDGRKVPFQTFKRSGASLLVPMQLAGGSAKAEVGYPLQGIAKIEAPKPAEIDSAARSLSAGRADEAIAVVAPVIALYGQAREVPGQWWSQAALQVATALERKGDSKGAGSLFREIAATKSDAVAATLAELKMLAFQSEKSDPAALLMTLDKMQPALEKMGDDSVLAEFSLRRASVLLAARRFREALESSLSVIVFYPFQTGLHAPATLCAARACLGLDDLPRSRMYLEDLRNQYVGSPELAAAKEDFARLERREGKKAETQPPTEPTQK